MEWNLPNHQGKERERKKIIAPGVTETLYQNATMAPIRKPAEERQSRILDAIYSAVNIDIYVAEIAHLSRDQKLNLAKTLRSYRDQANEDAMHFASSSSVSR